MRRIGFTLMVVLLILCNANAQVTTYFYGRDKVQSKNQTGALYSVKIYDNYVYVTIELIPTKNRNRMTFFTSPYTYVQAGNVRLPFLGALSNDEKSYHSCTPDDGWGWSKVKKGQTYHYTLVFSGTIPAGITNFSLIDDYSYYHGYSFRNYTINNPNTNKTSFSEYSVKQNVDENNDGICGIYEGFDNQGYKLGCVKQNGTYYLIYLGDKDNMSWWQVGDVKAVLRPSATMGFFKADWYMANKTKESDAYVVFEGGSMKTVVGNEESGYLKMYPTTQNNKISYEHQEWSGTGFALNNGYVVTNFHVIDNAKTIQIQGIDGDFSVKYNASIIATDKYNDLALLRINDSRFTGFGNIPYNIKTTLSDVGEEIFVLGYPLTSTMGDEIKLTTGVISSKTGFQGDVSLYQISAPIQPGNSGGPLFDYQGNLVGIVNAKHKGAENVGYAIKTSYLKNLIESSITTSILPNDNQTVGLPLTSKVKSLKNFVYMISCSNVASSNNSNYTNGNTDSNIDIINPSVSIIPNDNKGLKIKRVQITQAQTIVELEYDNSVNGSGWITISPNTYIVSFNTGKKYSMIRAEGIPIEPQKHYFNSAYEKVQFKLIFPALPQNTTKFNLIESESSSWKFYGIELK